MGQSLWWSSILWSDQRRTDPRSRNPLEAQRVGRQMILWYASASRINNYLQLLRSVALHHSAASFCEPPRPSLRVFGNTSRLSTLRGLAQGCQIELRKQLKTSKKVRLSEQSDIDLPFGSRPCRIPITLTPEATPKVQFPAPRPGAISRRREKAPTSATSGSHQRVFEVHFESCERSPLARNLVQLSKADIPEIN